MHRYDRFWFAPVILLWLYMLSRMYHLLAMPPFIDEYLHILWARDVYQGRFLTGAENGRLLALWYMSLFQMTGNGLLWLTRTVTVLFAALNVAVIYSLGRLWVTRSAGMVGALLYILTPFVFFHDRLGLSDAYVSTLGMLALWFSVRFTRRQRGLDAILAGFMVMLAITAKATGLMLIVIPATCILLLLPWRRGIRGMILAYSAFMATWLPLFIVLRWRHYDYFGVATQVVGTSDTTNLLQRLAAKVPEGLAFNMVYLSAVGTAVALLLMLYLIVRRGPLGLMLVISTTLPLVGILAFAGKLTGRYLLLHVPMLIVLVAVALGVLANDLNRRGRRLRPGIIIVLAGVAVWGIFFALPFQIQAWRDPAGLDLPDEDRLEYVEADSSGYALPETAAYLQASSVTTGKGIHVIGLLSNCGSLSLLLPSQTGVEVECPYLMWTGENQKALSALIDERASAVPSGNIPDLWIASEGLPYATLDGVTARYGAVVTFTRPGNLTKITLYRVEGS